MGSLTSEQLRRYSRNIRLEGFGKEGQELLMKASVLIIGTGALGSVVSMYLAASGIGHIGIADFDTIDISNLQRQLSFTETDCGKFKVEATAAKLHDINSEIEVTIYNRFLRPVDFTEISKSYDVVVECTDNPASKYMVTDACASQGKPYCFGGVAQYEGQVLSWRPGVPTYRDIFPEAASEGDYMPCSLGGVLGPLPGIVGSVQASEVIKIITGIGTPLYGRMLLIDALSMSFRTIDF